MTEETQQNKQQLEITELRLRLKSLVENTRILEGITRDLLMQVIKDKKEQTEFRAEHTLILKTLYAYTNQNEALCHAFAFKTPDKLEKSLVRRCEALPLEDHMRLIQRIRNGELTHISELPRPKKKKASK